LDLVILLAEHDEPTLAAKKKRQLAPLKLATSTPKNRVWGFENIPSGRPCVEFDLTWETAIGSVQYTYRNASGRAEWLSRDPIAERGGINLYDYVGNDPIDGTDPFGLHGGTCPGGPDNTPYLKILLGFEAIPILLVLPEAAAVIAKNPIKATAAALLAEKAREQLSPPEPDPTNPASAPPPNSVSPLPGPVPQPDGQSPQEENPPPPALAP
jgi:RHS repeat-associated protein